MARNTSFSPYDEPVDAFGDDPDVPELMDYESAPSRAVDLYSLPEDPVPLFLSNDTDEPRQSRFGSGGENSWKPPLWPKVMKLGILAAIAAGIAFAIVSVDNPLAIFANAKASLIGSSQDQPVAATTGQAVPATAVLASAAPAAPAADSRAVAPAANLMPSRDDIALALRAAHQSQREAEQQPAVAPVAVATAAPTATLPVAAAPVAAAPVASAPVTAPPVRRLGADELATLIKRAKNLISIGDIAPARLLLERAADAQEPTAALLLAQTYDPAVLGVTDMRSITPDPAMARDWYEKAARLGSADARQRLTQMQN